MQQKNRRITGGGVRAGAGASAIAFALAVGVQTLPAAAEESDTAVQATPEKIQELVVTARHREESAQDVPLSVSIFGGETVKVQHLDRVADYAFKLPNFGALQQNPRVSALTIRGLGGNANSDGSESGVGLIIDNVFMTHVGFTWLDLVDLESVQLARGPQGTLLGKNTTIGAMIVSTQRPSFDPSADIGVTYGNRNRGQFRANITGPIIDDHLAYRLTAAGDRSEGSTKNHYNGKDFLDSNRASVRGQLFYKDDGISDRVILESNYSAEYNNFYPPASDVNNFVNGAPRNSWTARMISRFNYTPSFKYPNNANVDTQQPIRQRTHGVSNELNVDVGDHTLTSITAWRRFFFRPRNDTDNSPFPILRAGFDVDVDQTSQELRLASPASETFDYQVGLYYLHENIASQLRQFLFDDASKYFLSPAVPSAVLNGIEYSQSGHAKIDSIAAFGQATYHFNDALALTLGARYTREQKEASNDGFTRGGATLSLPGQIAQRNAIVNAFGGVFGLQDKVNTNSPSWLINPAWRINDHLMAYVNVGYGEKSGAANLTATPGKPVIIDPEKSTDYEVGVKSQWLDGALTANVDLYWNIIKGLHAAQVDPNLRITGSYLGNVGKVRLRGVEFEGAYAPIEGLTLSLSAAYNDAEYLKYDNAPPPLEYAYPGAPPTLSLTGERVTGAPKWSGQVSLDYSQPIGDGYEGFGYLNTRVRSEVAFINPRSQYGRQSGYSVTNLGFGVREANGRYALQFWSKNLFDKRYTVGAGAAGGASPEIAILGDPRSYGLTLSAKL